jgi:hypothetical protein
MMTLNGFGMKEHFDHTGLTHNFYMVVEGREIPIPQQTYVALSTLVLEMTTPHVDQNREEQDQRAGGLDQSYVKTDLQEQDRSTENTDMFEEPTGSVQEVLQMKKIMEAKAAEMSEEPGPIMQEIGRITGDSSPIEDMLALINKDQGSSDSDEYGELIGESMDEDDELAPQL